MDHAADFFVHTEEIPPANEVSHHFILFDKVLYIHISDMHVRQENSTKFCMYQVQD